MLYLREMRKINSVAKSTFAGGSHHSRSQIFLYQFSNTNYCLIHRVTSTYRWLTLYASKHPEIWRGKIKTKLYLADCVFEKWPVGSACHRLVLDAGYQGTMLTRMVKWETKIHNAVAPALALLLASSIWIIMLLSLSSNGPGFDEMFEEHNLFLAWINFPSQILAFMAQVLFISEILLQWEDAFERTEEFFWGCSCWKAHSAQWPVAVGV